jgi:hypothetical protein
VNGDAAAVALKRERLDGANVLDDTGEHFIEDSIPRGKRDRSTEDSGKWLSHLECGGLAAAFAIAARLSLLSPLTP